MKKKLTKLALVVYLYPVCFVHSMNTLDTLDDSVEINLQNIYPLTDASSDFHLGTTKIIENQQADMSQEEKLPDYSNIILPLPFPEASSLQQSTETTNLEENQTDSYNLSLLPDICSMNLLSPEGSSLLSHLGSCNRPLSNPSNSEEFLGAHGAQDRSVLDVREDPSTGATQKLPEGQMFRKKSNVDLPFPEASSLQLFPTTTNLEENQQKTPAQILDGKNIQQQSNDIPSSSSSTQEKPFEPFFKTLPLPAYGYSCSSSSSSSSSSTSNKMSISAKPFEPFSKTLPLPAYSYSSCPVPDSCCALSFQGLQIPSEPSELFRVLCELHERGYLSNVLDGIIQSAKKSTAETYKIHKRRIFTVLFYISNEGSNTTIPSYISNEKQTSEESWGLFNEVIHKKSSNSYVERFMAAYFYVLAHYKRSEDVNTVMNCLCGLIYLCNRSEYKYVPAPNSIFPTDEQIDNTIAESVKQGPIKIHPLKNLKTNYLNCVKVWKFIGDIIDSHERRHKRIILLAKPQ